MGAFGWIDWTILIIYFFAMAALGPLFARRTRTTEGYFLGRRAFPGWLIGISMFATSISSVTVVAMPADAYKTAYLRWLPGLMLPVGVYLATVVFLPYFRKCNTTSAFEYLEKRFGPMTRMYAASVFIFGQLIRLSLILYLVAILVREMTGLDPLLCIVIGGLVTSFYTITGGIEAVVWTDFIQSFLLWGGGFAILIVVILGVDGGIPAIVSMAWNEGKFVLGDPDPVSKQPVQAPWFSLLGKSIIMMFIVGLNDWLTEYSSNQNVIQKYVASKSPRDAMKSVWICVLCSVPTWTFFMFLGTCLYAFYASHPDPVATAMLNGERKPEGILPHFVIHNMPTGFTGLVVAGVLAAAMSSLSSSINAISAVGIVDIYRRLVAPGRSDTHYVAAAKTISIAASVLMLFGAAGLLLANDQTLLDTNRNLAGLFAGGLLGLYCLGFLTQRGDGRAAMMGIACTLVWTAYMTAGKLGWTVGMYQSLGFTESTSKVLALPVDAYYAGLFGNILMFAIGFAVAKLVRRAPRDLTNLTVWTQDETPMQ